MDKARTGEEKYTVNELYDYWNGEDWILVGENLLSGIELEGLKSIFKIDKQTIRCEYKNNKEVYYRKIHKIWVKSF